LEYDARNSFALSFLETLKKLGSFRVVTTDVKKKGFLDKLVSAGNDAKLIASGQKKGKSLDDLLK
jgi:hypothetical protein